MEQINELIATLMQAQEFLPQNFVDEHKLFFIEEHLQNFSKRLLSFQRDGVPKEFPLPHFVEECTPPLSLAYTPFADVMQQWNNKGGSSEIAKDFAAAMVAAKTDKLLILLGQRRTPGSISDARAIPPTTQQLLTVAEEVGKQGLSVVARAWTKHVHRCPSRFWGEVKGSAAEKNKRASELTLHVLHNKTWWNVFGHYKHELVFEARVASGHGMRWGKIGQEFIGFLEPFLDPEQS